MPWTITVISFVILLAFPLAGRGRGVHVCLALAAVAWIITLSVTVLASDLLASLFDLFSGPALHDTYYVVSHVHVQLVVTALMALLSLAAWSARPVHKSATTAFWVGHVALVLASLMPPFVTTEPNRLAWLNTATGLLAILSALAFLNLGAIVIYHLAARVRGSR